MKKAIGDFSFLSITPLPGLSLIKQGSTVLLALSICEAVSLLLYSPHLLLVLYVLIQASFPGATALYALHVCSHSNDTNIPRLQILVRTCFLLKLATLCIVLALTTHKLFGSQEIVCVGVEELQECTERDQWWQLSTAGLRFEMGFAALGSGPLGLIWMRVAKAAVEMRYRSLAYYLEL